MTTEPSLRPSHVESVNFLNTTGKNRLILCAVGLVGLVLLEIPTDGRGGLAAAVAELAIVAGPQEVGHAVPIDTVERHGAVKCRSQLLPGEEAQRVPDVHDGVAGPGLDAAPLKPLSRLGADEVDGTEDLQTPLLREEKRERADVCVLVLPERFLRQIHFRVVDEEKGALGRCIIAVVLLQALMSV